jgi:hypothetical protein
MGISVSQRRSEDVNYYKLLLLLFFISCLTGVVVEDGVLSSVDVSRRLQIARSWYTDEPEVRDEDYRDGFGLIVPDGTTRAWYGVGQAITLLPADILSHQIVDQLNLAGPLSEKIQRAVLVYLYSSIIAGLGCISVFLMLQTLGFSQSASVAGVLSLLYCSTYLQYTQENQENSLLML